MIGREVKSAGGLLQCFPFLSRWLRPSPTHDERDAQSLADHLEPAAPTSARAAGIAVTAPPAAGLWSRFVAAVAACFGRRGKGGSDVPRTSSEQGAGEMPRQEPPALARLEHGEVVLEDGSIDPVSEIAAPDPEKSVEPPSVPASEAPPEPERPSTAGEIARPRVFVQLDGRTIDRKEALEAKRKIVKAYRANRRHIDALFKEADSKADRARVPRPKFVKTGYRPAKVAPRELSKGDGRTPQGQEIDERGMENYHYRDHKSALEEGSPRTLSHFCEVPSDGMSGNFNKVTVGPRGFVLRVERQLLVRELRRKQENDPTGEIDPAGMTKTAPNLGNVRLPEIAPLALYAQLESFVPAISVEAGVGIARHAGPDLMRIVESRTPVPLRAFRQASRDLDRLNAEGRSFSDLQLPNLTVANLHTEPRVKFIDCDFIGALTEPYGDAAKFVDCVACVMAPDLHLWILWGRYDRSSGRDIAGWIDQFVDRYVKAEFRAEVSRYLRRAPGAKIQHPTQQLFDWDRQLDDDSHRSSRPS